jgi:hypothetical protein
MLGGHMVMMSMGSKAIASERSAIMKVAISVTKVFDLPVGTLAYAEHVIDTGELDWYDAEEKEIWSYGLVEE